MTKFKISYNPFGEKALLVEWPPRIEQAILEDIIRFQKIIEKELSKEIIECILAYQSLTIVFNSEKTTYADLLPKIKQFENFKKNEIKLERRRWYLPICYDPEFGPDQELVANLSGLPVHEIVHIHQSCSYTVYFIGFLPGFLYLGGLPEVIHTARKATPDPLIPKGAVAIGGSQTGIYPQESPGGWNVIGRTPVSLFDVNQNPPCFALPGDLLQFIPIDKHEYSILENQIKIGEFKIRMDLPDL
ncbi:5-oxoprolinase subunit PxpB [soil metagenome]